MLDSIAKSIINNLIDVMCIAVKSSAHNEAGIKDLSGSLRYFSGCEFPFFNGVFNNYKNQAKEIKDNLPEITQFFSEKNKPFIWWWMQPSELPIEIKKELDDQNFQFLGEFSGIAAQLDQIHFNIHPDTIEIKCVDNHNDYKKFIAIICDVFQLSDSIKKDFEEMYKSYGFDGKFNHYLGFYADEPVATLTSYRDEKILGLYNGATLPKAQKKGLCSALIHNAIKEAKNSGAEFAIAQLMAPGMAKGLTEKMGFKNYCRLLPFLKAPYLA